MMSSEQLRHNWKNKLMILITQEWKDTTTGSYLNADMQVSWENNIYIYCLL